MKLSRLILGALLGLALAGCHFTDHSDAPDASANSAAVPDNRTATLSWDAPTTTMNGTALTDLAGYRIYYGMDKSDLTQVVQLNNVGVQTYVIDNLGTGTWYFAVRAVSNNGAESPLSQIVSKTIG